MQRHQKFARWLIGIGIIVLILNTINFLVASNWGIFALNIIMLLAIIIYFLSVWMSGHTPE